MRPLPLVGHMGVTGRGMVKGKKQKIRRVLWLLQASACPATFVPLGLVDSLTAKKANSGAKNPDGGNPDGGLATVLTNCTHWMRDGRRGWKKQLSQEKTQRKHLTLWIVRNDLFGAWHLV